MAVSTIYSYGSSNRITGMFSGLDTDTLVQNMLKIEQYKVDNSYKAKTKLEWKQEAYTTVNDAVKAFQDKYLSATSASNMWSRNVYSAYTTNMSENKYISAKATSSAFAMNYTITAATKATYAEITGSKYMSRSNAVGTAGANNISQIQGGVVTDKDGNAITGDTKLSDIAELGEKENFSFTINGQSFAFDKDDTVNDMIAAVNEKSGATNVEMSLGDDGSLSLSNIRPSSSASISITEGSGGLFDSKDEDGNDTAGKLGLSTKNITKVNTLDVAAALSDHKNVDAIFGDSQTVKIAINGEEYVFDRDTDSIQSIMDKINGPKADGSESDVIMSYEYDPNDPTKAQFTIKAKDASKNVTVKNIEGNFFGSASPVGISAGTSGVSTSDTIARAAEKMGIKDAFDADGNFSFTVNGKTFTFSSSTKLSDMMQKVNADTEVGVQMVYSEITDSFSFRTLATGSESKIELANAGDSKAFGEGGFFGIDTYTAAGTDATMTFMTSSGEEETITRSSNTFTVDGVTYTIKEDFKAADSSENISFDVTQDNTSVINKVKAFVEDYNKLVETINNLITQEKDYDYGILSEAEREDLTEEELEMWDEKAKSGILRNDTYLRGLLTSLRSALYETVGDTGLSASSIGLTTGSWETRGQITLNEDRLRAALEKNPDVVGEVLAGVSSSKDASVARSENGLMTRMFHDMSNFQSNMRNTILAGIKEDVRDYESKIDEQLADLYEKQEEYYQQFAALETIMSNYQSQSSYMSSLLGM